MKENCVSVIIITYAQEKFIRHAINGVLSQKYFGEIELLICDDCSPDFTDKIVENIILNESIPKNVRIVYHKNQSNLGIVPNFVSALKKAKGQFIAICEGDDYWTDPLKLEKQVDYLTNNADCNLVYHRVMLYDEDSKLFTKEHLNKEDFTLKRNLDTLTRDGNFIHTPSVVFRNNINFDSPLFNGVVGDYILWYLNGEKGLYGYLPDYMAVYRIWNGGVWSKRRRATTHFTFAKMLTRMSKSSNDPVISNNLRQQSIDTLLRIGFSEMSFKEKINYTYFILKYDRRPLRTLLRKIKKLRL
ncbi:glycosyltransferase [Sphingobacterium chungjuense]|uniref:glycosyltransferase n=1 Tax=Sphingobacterium chungjuense TaxID=2675553 RepID=UPI0014082092|nr:glycosyltransferase [Sphingobacterium chungjuense]